MSRLHMDSLHYGDLCGSYRLSIKFTALFTVMYGDD